MVNKPGTKKKGSIFPAIFKEPLSLLRARPKQVCPTSRHNYSSPSTTPIIRSSFVYYSPLLSLLDPNLWHRSSFRCSLCELCGAALGPLLGRDRDKGPLFRRSPCHHHLPADTLRYEVDLGRTISHHGELVSDFVACEDVCALFPVLIMDIRVDLVLLSSRSGIR